MQKAEGIYAGAVLLEGSVLLINSVLALVWLCRLEIERNMNAIRVMILTTLLISCVLIPVESLVFHMFRKRRAPEGQTAQTRIVRTVLPRLIYVFLALWFLRAMIFEIMAVNNHWRHGSDVYMYYARPSSRIILLSALGVQIPNWVVNKGE